MNIFTQFFNKAAKDPDSVRSQVKRDLIRREAAIGREVFGPIPVGHAREFFRVDRGTWIWQETWRDASGIKQSRHTKYSVRERDILKSVNSGSYQSLSLEEAKNFEAAAREYVLRVSKEVYQSNQLKLR